MIGAWPHRGPRPRSMVSALDVSSSWSGTMGWVVRAGSGELHPSGAGRGPLAKLCAAVVDTLRDQCSCCRCWSGSEAHPCRRTFSGFFRDRDRSRGSQSRTCEVAPTGGASGREKSPRATAGGCRTASSQTFTCVKVAFSPAAPKVRGECDQGAWVTAGVAREMGPTLAEPVQLRRKSTWRPRP